MLRDGRYLPGPRREKLVHLNPLESLGRWSSCRQLSGQWLKENEALSTGSSVPSLALEASLEVWLGWNNSLSAKNKSRSFFYRADYSSHFKSLTPEFWLWLWWQFTCYGLLAVSLCGKMKREMQWMTRNSQREKKKRVRLESYNSCHCVLKWVNLTQIQNK